MVQRMINTTVVGWIPTEKITYIHIFVLSVVIQNAAAFPHLNTQCLKNLAESGNQSVLSFVLSCSSPIHVVYRV